MGMFDEYLAHYDECVEYFLMSEDEKDGLYHYQVPGAHWYTHDENRRQQSEKQYAKGKDTKGFIPPEEIIKKKIDRAKAKKKEKDKNKKDGKETVEDNISDDQRKTSNGLSINLDSDSERNSILSSLKGLFGKDKHNKYDENGLKLLSEEESLAESREKVNPNGPGHGTPGLGSINKSDPISKLNEALYTNNCTNCTIAYELRRRGYDVEAKGREAGRLTIETTDIFRGASRGTLYSYIDRPGSYDDRSVAKAYERSQQAEQKLLSMGEGARGELHVNFWYGGHSLHWENSKNGYVIITDAQVNKTYDFNQVVSQANEIKYYRLDDVDFDPDKIKQWVKNSGE